jgi:indolepyruvate ferredoxin oxidoreductase
VDRSGDIFRHANLAGTGDNCAALVLGGDDHLSKSSTIPHQSDLSFYNFGMPVFYPGNTQEILDYGLLAIALSRFSGAWVAMKMVTNVCDGGGTVELDPERLAIGIPSDYKKHFDARLLIPFTLQLEHEVNYRRLAAVREFARANRVNRMFGAGDGARLGIATAGKPYYDLMQCLRDLGIRREQLDTLGVRVAKFGLTFPLEPHFVTEFARGLETLVVIEEKRSFLELQLRELLYNAQQRPTIVGKNDENGQTLVPATAELDPEKLAHVLARYLPPRESVAARLNQIAEIASRHREKIGARPPTFCPGCPHNRSTIVLEGQVAAGGIGCHGMAALDAHSGRGYSFLTHMGGEGAPWIGMAPFVERKHIFQNIGDGTYFHSGSLAIEACRAAGVNITFKILYNGAVAMTGGQEPSGALPVPELTRKLEADGVHKTVVLTDDIEKYAGISLAGNAQVLHRDELPVVMRELEQIPGVTAIVYDQQCAAEKRRLRSRGKLQEPALRLVINEAVCEGCGDCVRQSNCMSLLPVETEFGQKTRIHQSSCNKDYSCALGDCPSFVTVKLKPGTGLRKKSVPQLPAADVREPRETVAAGDGYSILAPGIGGTGVVTINALLATAAWLENISAITLDQTGLAQKGGAVVSSIILSERPVEASAKIGYGNADLILGFDLLGVAHADNLNRAHPSRTIAVINTAEIPTSNVVRGQSVLYGAGRLIDLIDACTRRGRNIYVDATRIAESLFSSHLAVNVFLLGVAYQGGLIPLSARAIEEAIRLNRVEAERNLLAFLWGRKYYVDARSVEEILEPPIPQSKPLGLIERRVRELEWYQDRRYAQEYRAFVESVTAREPALAEPVARYLYKLMAFKDEYEVARLLAEPGFEEQVRNMWEAAESIRYNVHPPFLRAFGLKKKMQLGPWFRVPLRLLARLKVLRGTPFDPFGYARLRKEERALVAWYRNLIEEILARVTPDNLPLAMEIAALPDQIRGYENIKMEKIREVRRLAAEKLAQVKQAPRVPA